MLFIAVLLLWVLSLTYFSLLSARYVLHEHAPTYIFLFVLPWLLTIWATVTYHPEKELFASKPIWLVIVFALGYIQGCFSLLHGCFEEMKRFYQHAQA
jgi:hypothetical protein